MIKADELAPDIWVFSNSESGRHWGVAFSKGRALVIDPGEESKEQYATARFLAENRSEVAEIAPLHQLPAGPQAVHHSQITTFFISDHRPECVPLTSFPDWEVVPLASDTGDRIALFNKSASLLFVGEMLAENFIPDLAGGSRHYLENLDKLEGLDSKLVVSRYGAPARGRRAVRGRITTDRNYTLALQGRVTSYLASGATLDRILGVVAQLYEDFPHLPAHLQNSRSIWDELAREKDR